MKYLERATSSGGSFAKPAYVACFSIFVAASGTTSANPLGEAAMVPLRTERTDAGQARKEETEHVVGMSELRRLSGLTWDQVALLFDVSRRAVHHWASGKPMTAKHETHLQRILSSLRTLHRDSIQPNRQSLFTSAEPGGASIFDLLRDRKYEQVAQLVGPPEGGRPVRSQVIVSADRLPLKPAQLVSTVDDAFDAKPSPLKKARVVRIKRA